MILQTQAHRVVLKSAEPAFHGDQTLPATNAVHGFLVALLQDAALDHRGNLWQQLTVGSLRKVAANPPRRAASGFVSGLLPGAIALAGILPARHVYLVLVDFLRGIGPGIDHVPLAVKDVAITVDLPQHLIVLSFGSGRRSYAKAVNLLHRVQSFLEFFFSPARSQIARRPSHDHNAHAQTNHHPKPVPIAHDRSLPSKLSG